MKKYLLGLFAVVLAVGFSAFTTSTKLLNTFKIIRIDNVAGVDHYITNDASTDVVSVCGSGFDVCKIETNLSTPKTSGTTYYFLLGDGTYSTGDFQ